VNPKKKIKHLKNDYDAEILSFESDDKDIVEEILKHRYSRNLGRYEYLVRWEGCREE
jgi:hypothetical protein